MGHDTPPPRAPSTSSKGIWTLLAPTPVPPSQKVFGALGPYIIIVPAPFKVDLFGRLYN